jgi:hypothetical protein
MYISRRYGQNTLAISSTERGGMEPSSSTRLNSPVTLTGGLFKYPRNEMFFILSLKLSPL